MLIITILTDELHWMMVLGVELAAALVPIREILLSLLITKSLCKMYLPGRKNSFEFDSKDFVT